MNGRLLIAAMMAAGLFNPTLRAYPKEEKKVKTKFDEEALEEARIKRERKAKEKAERLNKLCLKNSQS